MRKEIKFRAWHFEQKRMFEVYGLGIDFVTENTFDGIDYGTNAFCGDDMNFIEIMQSTGIKDCNGKEIYEGDIFTDVFRNDNFGIVTYGDYTHCFDDKRLSDFGAHVGFYLKFTNSNLPRKDLKYWSKMKEVVGNIYETPELISTESVFP